MGSNEELYVALMRKRDEIRDMRVRAHGRKPRVCSDEACMEMVRLRPQKLNDLGMISGIGDAFIGKYGKDFLDIINEYNVKDGMKVESVSMDRSVQNALQELEKKLVNISRRNRLLFMPRVTNAKEGFDLSLLMYRHNPLNALFNGKVVNLAKPMMKGPDGKRINYYYKLAQLHRNLTRIHRDKGQNDMYIGYPFVEGCLPGDDFLIRAPLVLFPVNLVKTPDNIDLVLDDTRDVVFNNTLVLAYYKTNGIRKPLPDNQYSEPRMDDFFGTVLNHYYSIGLDIKFNGDSTVVEEFVNHPASKFPSYRQGEMHLHTNVVIGRFPTYSNSIQKDFDRIVGGRMVNPLLDELLVGDSSTVDTAQSDSIYDRIIMEGNLVYINDINSAQEEVLAKMENTDRLVIQGPPGTGKSQTITNIVADYANRRKTVLVVSEKKAALDVVHSRLGDLSKYSMLIDDVNNKDLFYSQMISILRSTPPENPSDVTSDELSKEIESGFDDLYYISRNIFQPCSFGIDPYWMYINNERADLNDKRQREKFNVIKNAFSERMMEYSYADISSIKEKFKRSSTVTTMTDCFEMRAQHPWMMDLDPNLNEVQVESAKMEMVVLRKDIEDWAKSGFFSRMLNKTRIKKRITDVFEKYWQYYRCDDPMTTYADMDMFMQGLEHYDEFFTVSNAYDALNDKEKIYVDALRKIIDEEVISPNLANGELFNYMLMRHLEDFEADHQDILDEMERFEEINRDLDAAITKKKEVLRNEIKCKLAKEVEAISSSKRFGDMIRAIGMKRRWSVNKFVGRFDYELLRGIRVWLLTPDVVSEIMPIDSGLFDLVIFDEASQMFIEKAVPSIMRAKKVIIAGDHKQLRPSRLGAGRIGMDEDDVEDEGEVPIYEEATSLLDVARFKYPSIMLNYHYRSEYEELISFSNHAFYNGRLYVSPNLDVGIEPPITVHHLDKGRWKDRCNTVEATKVVEIIRGILTTRKERDTIGVITFNSTQMDLVESLLEKECSKDKEFAKMYHSEVMRKENGEDVGLFVKNIENVQGDERDIIIFSIGYAKGDNGKIARNFGWLNQEGGENRLNVAISRARRKIHVVTSIHPSQLDVDDMKNEGPKLLKRYLEYCFAVSSGDTETVKAMLSSMNCIDDRMDYTAMDNAFTNKIYRALLKHGFDIERNVGIGGYCIDMAIKKDGRYVLGIECDGRLYHSNMGIRERDYHRRKYLESRGWTMYRMWSSNWWRDPAKEISKIEGIVNSTSCEGTTPPDTATPPA